MLETNRIEYKSIFKISDNFLEISFPFEEGYDNENKNPLTEEKELVDGLVERLVDGLVDGLVESQQKIVRLMASNPNVTIKELSESIGISTTAIDKNITKLKDRNIIRRVGSDSSGYWEIITS